MKIPCCRIYAKGGENNPERVNHSAHREFKKMMKTGGVTREGLSAVMAIITAKNARDENIKTNGSSCCLGNKWNKYHHTKTEKKRFILQQTMHSMVSALSNNSHLTSDIVPAPNKEHFPFLRKESVPNSTDNSPDPIPPQPLTTFNSDAISSQDSQEESVSNSTDNSPDPIPPHPLTLFYFNTTPNPEPQKEYQDALLAKINELTKKVADFDASNRSDWTNEKKEIRNKMLKCIEEHWANYYSYKGNDKNSLAKLPANNESNSAIDPTVKKPIFPQENKDDTNGTNADPVVSAEKYDLGINMDFRANLLSQRIASRERLLAFYMTKIDSTKANEPENVQILSAEINELKKQLQEYCENILKIYKNEDDAKDTGNASGSSDSTCEYAITEREAKAVTNTDSGVRKITLKISVKMQELQRYKNDIEKGTKEEHLNKQKPTTLTHEQEKQITKLESEVKKLKEQLQECKENALKKYKNKQQQQSNKLKFE